MLRKVLSLTALVASVTLILGTSNAQARHCGSRHNRHGCCQSNYNAFGNCGYSGHHQGNWGSGNCGYSHGGYQQIADYSYQQTSYASPNACCRPRATCCSVQPACVGAVAPASYSAPQPPMQQTPAPAPIY
jgi:hypothetical protein